MFVLWYKGLNPLKSVGTEGGQLVSTLPDSTHDFLWEQELASTKVSTRSPFPKLEPAMERPNGNSTDPSPYCCGEMLLVFLGRLVKSSQH